MSLEQQFQFETLSRSASENFADSGVATPPPIAEAAPPAGLPPLQNIGEFPPAFRHRVRHVRSQYKELYDLPVIQDIEDVYASGPVSEVLQIKTHYESLDIAQSNKVHYLQFMLPATPLPDKESALKILLLEEEADRRS